MPRKNAKDRQIWGGGVRFSLLTLDRVENICSFYTAKQPLDIPLWKRGKLYETEISINVEVTFYWSSYALRDYRNRRPTFYSVVEK
jgi:hypothetical protein